MKKISLDIETFSSVDLSKAGVYKYADSEDFEILLFAYSVDDGEVKVVDLVNGEKIPDEIINGILDEKVSKWAFNANFERICLSKYLGKNLSPSSWYCSMVWSLYLGLPLSLSMVGEVLGLEKKKLEEGKSLIRYFCMPSTPTKSNGFRKRNLPKDDLYKWERFIEYNKRDVETEMLIQKKLSAFLVPDFEWDNYYLDQRINDRGILLDSEFVKAAIFIATKDKEEKIKESIKLTGLENPNSPMQLKEWLLSQGVKTESLTKKDVDELIKTQEGVVLEVLKLRRELSKSSVKKYLSMDIVKGSDDRARGLIQFYGANRTGRYSGRLIQVQNLPRNYLKDLKLARDIVKRKDIETLEMLFGSVSQTLSELIRTAFFPSLGKLFIVSDFAAIETRVLAWLAGEKWRIEAFKNGEDIYCASASKMFGVVVKKNGENGHLRQKGKISELALGYNGSVGALKAMGAIDMGIEEDELQGLVDSWRESNSEIVSLWWDIDRIVKDVVKAKTKIKYKNLVFSYEKGILFIKLPSGRRLSYIKPKIGINRFGGESITYEGLSSSKKWERIESYGGKFVENIVQAIARDILAEAMIRLDKEGFEIVMHVHDEVVIESEEKYLKKVKEIMKQRPSWALDLILDCDAYVCEFYQKD